MSLSSRRRRLEVPTEGSWRMVDGENDSFDTRYLSSFDDDDSDINIDAINPAGSQLSIGYPSQYSFSASHDAGASFDSQDSIRDFNTRSGGGDDDDDDEQLILREPFRPTVPPSVTCGSSTSTATSRPSLYHFSPDLQLRMPRVDVDSDLTSSERESLRTSRGDWRWNQGASEAIEQGPIPPDDPEDCSPCQTRARRKSSQGQPRASLDPIRSAARRKSETSLMRRFRPKPEPSSTTAPVAPRGNPRRLLGYSIASIMLGLAAYFFYSGGDHSSLLRRITTSLDSVSLAPPSSLMPICGIPGISQLSPPFCDPRDSSHSRSAKRTRPRTQDKTEGSGAICSISFRDLITTQAKLQDILHRGHLASSIPLDLEASEIAARNLRSSLRDSTTFTTTSTNANAIQYPSSSSLSSSLSSPLIPELSNYIDKVGRAGPDLQALYIHIHSTVDAIININRWTIRHISALAVDPHDTPAPLPRLLDWARRILLLPGRSAADVSDQILLDKYVEHVLLVQSRIDRLIDEASSLGLLLSHAHGLLSSIHALAPDALPAPAPAENPSLLSNLWSFIVHSPTGSKAPDQAAPRDHHAHLEILYTVDAQLADVMAHIHHLVEALRDIRAELQDLLRQTAHPPDTWADDANDAPPSTLSEQITLVRIGLRGLEEAKRQVASP